MKQVAVNGKEQAGITTVEMPRAKDNWVLVKVHVAPMCTEYKAFAAGTSYPLMGA